MKEACGYAAKTLGVSKRAAEKAHAREKEQVRALLDAPGVKIITRLDWGIEPQKKRRFVAVVFHWQAMRTDSGWWLIASSFGAARMQTETEDTKVICGVRLKPRKSAAQAIHKSEATLIRWELDGKGPPVTRIGRDVYYAESDLEKWVRSQAGVTA
jgi:hypothetical protein